MARHINPVFFCGLEVNSIEFRVTDRTYYAEVLTGDVEYQSGFYGREAIMVPIIRGEFLALKEQLGVVKHLQLAK